MPVLKVWDGSTWVETPINEDHAARHMPGGGDILQVSATDRFLGRDTAGAGDVEEITKAAALAILNVEDGADVTDATNVNAAGAVMESDYGDIEILASRSPGGSPQGVPVAQGRLIGRLTGWIEELTGADAGSLIDLTDLADVAGETGTGSVVRAASPTMTGNVLHSDHAGFTQETVTYSSGTTTVAWADGNKQFLTFGAGNITTLAFTNPTAAHVCSLLLVIKQDGTGNRTVGTWDADIKWAAGTVPTLSTGANAIDIIALYWDGTNYYGLASLDFS